MSRKRILYVTPAIFPYLPENYISSVCRYLPQGIQERENEIRTFMPKYGLVNERKNMLHEVIRLSGQNIIIEDTDYPLIIKVASLQSVRMQVYFIDSEDFFRRKALYVDEDDKFFEDNDSRILFYAKGVIETVRKLGWNPDIIHCHGWLSALVPIFIRTAYKDNPLFQDVRIITSIYNEYFPDKFSPHFLKKLKITGIPRECLTHFKGASGYDTILKTAIDFSDAVVIAHPNITSSLKRYLKNYEYPTTIHHESEDYLEYVDEYNHFYEELLELSPREF
ncbi:MAG: glycogen/starch synthase [Bacteroidetes bacterium]|nr:glycogen/starch synthase [Bacteroidota bacterium]MCL1968579.1 glycogen/starch synthase [Bacteroidota bacterium]